MTIDYYPRYQSKPQAATCSSVIKMILALRTKLNSYKPFLCRIGIEFFHYSFSSFCFFQLQRALIHCCSNPLKSTIEQELENYELDLSEEKSKSLLSIGKMIAYENYLPLWKTILNVTTLKEFYTNIYSIFDR
ncbi:unnamed protein product [Rotaria sp. Silwood2]|nr:unnamed protein product [Rotaria sp. Silwood2]